MSELVAAVRERDAQLARARDVRRRALTAAVTALWRRQTMVVQGSVLVAWQTLTTARRAVRRGVARLQARRAWAVLSACLAALAAAARRRNRLGVALVRGLMATSRRKMAIAFRGWQVSMVCCCRWWSLDSCLCRAFSAHVCCHACVATS